MRDLSEVESKIGYAFRDRSLLETALTHASYVNEHGGESYERLEFLGDSVLNFVVAEALYRNTGDDEGKLTVLRARTVSKEPLSIAVQKRGLTAYLRTGAGAGNDTVSEKAVSDLFEAIVGAIYVDSGSLEPCKRFVFAHLEGGGRPDYKTQLQVLVQKRYKSVPVYESEATEHGFRSVVLIEGQPCGAGEGARKKDAEQAAARQALGRWQK